MAFTQFSLDKASSQSRDIFNVYVYQTDDLIADVKSAGYFSGARFEQLDGPETNSNGWGDGYIICNCGDGEFVGVIDSETGTAATSNQVGSFRAAWKTSNVRMEQFLTASDSPEVIAFTDETLPSPFVVSNLPAGEFTINISADVFITYSAEVTRELGGGIASWGVFIETEVSPGVWVEVPDSLRIVTLKSVENDDIENVEFSASTLIEAGSKFRFSQIATDHTKNIGLVSDKPFASAPAFAGFVLSLDIFY